MVRHRILKINVKIRYGNKIFIKHLKLDRKHKDYSWSWN